MPTWAWLLILAIVILVWWFWSQYGSTITFYNNNSEIVGLGQSVSRYTTDIAGLINAYQAQDADGGSFMSRLGAFVGALPK